MVFRKLMACVLLCLPLWTCGNDPSGQKDASGAEGKSAVTLRLPGGDWGIPTPFTFYPRGPGYIHLSLVYDTLIWKDAKGKVPLLAESWERSPDGLLWTFHLRPGVKWQDGAPLTARDVQFTFHYLKLHPVEWFPVHKILDVEAPDGLTVVFRLERPFAPFLNEVAGNVPIIPEHVWRHVQDPRDEGVEQRVVGSGPYRLVHYDNAQGSYAYKANGQYFLGTPRVDRILFVPAADHVAALQRGDVDEANIPASLVAQFEDKHSLAVMHGPAYWVLTVLFNRDRFPFSEEKVRHALACAIDRNALIEQAVPGGAQGAKPGNPGFLPPDSPWFDPANQDACPFDLNRAKTLLRSAGIEDRDGNGVCEGPDGTPMHYLLVTAPQYLREAEAIRLMLHRVGFGLEITPMDIKTMDATVRDRRFDLALTGRGGLGGDPSAIMGFGAGRDNSSTPGTPRDPEYLRAAKELVETVDSSRRTELCRTMQRLYAGELPTIPLYYPLSFTAYDPAKLTGWFYTAEGGIGIGVPMPLNKLVFIGEKQS